MFARPVHCYSISHIRSPSSSVLVVAESRVASRYKPSPPKSACSRWRAAETASAVSSQSCVGVWLAVRTTCMRTGSHFPHDCYVYLHHPTHPCMALVRCIMLSIAYANPFMHDTLSRHRFVASVMSRRIRQWQIDWFVSTISIQPSVPRSTRRP